MHICKENFHFGCVSVRGPVLWISICLFFILPAEIGSRLRVRSFQDHQEILNRLDTDRRRESRLLLNLESNATFMRPLYVTTNSRKNGLSLWHLLKTFTSNS